MALCGGIVLEEALDLSFDRLRMMMMISPQVTFSLKEVQRESEKQVACRSFLAFQIIANKPFKVMANLKYI